MAQNIYTGVLKSFRSLIFAVTVFPMRSITSLHCIYMLFISQWVLSSQGSLQCQSYVKCIYIWGILSDLRQNLPCLTEVQIGREADVYWELLDAGYFQFSPQLLEGQHGWPLCRVGPREIHYLFTEILAKIQNSFFLFFAAMKLKYYILKQNAFCKLFNVSK